MRALVPVNALAKSVACDADSLRVQFLDGRQLSVPLHWFPRLLSATPEQLRNYEIGGGGVSLHWPEIDEDLSVAGLLAGADPRSM